MTRVIVTGHGGFPTGLKDAAELILGEQPGLGAAALDPDGTPEALRGELEQLAAGAGGAGRPAAGDGALILADLVGGTPYNTAAAIAFSRPEVEVVGGVGLAMLVEVLTAEPGLGARELAQRAVRAGVEGVQRLEVPRASGAGSAASAAPGTPAATAETPAAASAERARS